MSFYKKRSECPICEKNKKKFIFKYLNMPIFISTKIGKNTHDLYCDQTYVKCLSCNCVFIDEIIDASILYSWNHNANPVGKLWQRHFEKFKNFILNQVSSNEIIEIGGASGKLAKMFENYNEINKWEIIEPNPPDDYYESNKIKLNKIRIEDYVLENNTKDIVMSHVFEHFVNPTKILELIREKSRIGTNVIISIPNLENILKNKSLSIGGLHFEHTFFYTKNDIIKFFNLYGFKLNKCELFENHSIFMSFTLSDKLLNSRNICFENLADSFHEIYSDLNNDIKFINKKINELKLRTYIFGAHIQSQIFLSSGIDENLISGILDNSQDKQGKKLYGTNLLVSKPDIIKNNNCCVIIRMGPYTNEIVKQIKDINPNTIIL